MVYEVKAPPDAELCAVCGHQVVHHGYNGCYHTRIFSEGPMKMSMVCDCALSWGVEAAMDKPYVPPSTAYNTQPLATLGAAVALAFADATFARGALLELD